MSGPDVLPDVLVVGPLRPDQMAELERAYTLHRYDQAADKDGFLNGTAPKIRAVVTTGGFGFTADLLAKLPNLEIVGSSGVGVDKIDVAACRARGIPVTNTPDVLNDDVADLAFGLVIACLRAMPAGHDYVRSGDWGQKGMMRLTTTLSGKTLGIVGLGRIGREIADRARAFRMKVAYTGRNRQDVPFDYVPDLRALARAADVLMLTVPGGEATRNLVGAAELEALGPDGWLVSVARGSVVDETALVAALKAGTIRGCRARRLLERAAPRRGARRAPQRRSLSPPCQRDRRDPRRHVPARGRQPRGAFLRAPADHARLTEARLIAA